MSELFNNYDEYVNFQIRRAKRTAGQTVLYKPRREYIYQQILKHKIEGKSVLCAGARHNSEVDFFEERGFSPVVGIDLFANGKIICCDMSKMLEHPVLQKQKFDIVISIESIEHCLNIDGFVFGLNHLCKKYFICMCPVIAVPSHWDCRSLPFMLNLTGNEDLKTKLEGYFSKFVVRYCEIQRRGKRLFFILEKREPIVESEVSH